MVHIEIDRKKLKHAMHGKRDAVAAHLGLHPNSISRKLSGKQVMMIDEINRIADFLGHDATDFLILSDTETRWKVMRVG
jgi:plasmid maintenance system antidote protein VapI